ncbi:MAG TPA: histidine kinase dimerization/phospho-acceptor domain-containing protein, partial [Tepidisphaeraceae bacterium]
MGSLRSKLVLGTAAATVAIFLLAAVAIYAAARGSLLSEFDAASVAKANAIASAVELKDQHVIIELEPGRFPAFEGGEHPEYFTVWSDQSRELLRSASLQQGQLLQPTRQDAEMVTLPDGRSGRQVSISFKPHVDEDSQPSAKVPGLRLAIARGTAELDHTLASLRWVLTIVCGIGTLLLLALTAWIIGIALRPVDRLAQRIGGIGETNLAERLAPADVPQELAPVVQRLNDLLARLQSAFERERAFTADAAHELRTPLAGLAAALEVCASRPRETQAYEQTVHDCLKVVRNMHGMIENLLMLARADAGQIRQERSDVDLPKLLRETWNSFSAAADARRVRLEWNLNGSPTIRSDRQKLAQILSNLFDNATRYVDD